MQTSLFNNTGPAAAGADGSAVNPAADQASQTSDMFTKLLVAQIKNQDPLAPTDPSQFVNQLAQLSQTEALQNLSTLTSANASVMQSMQVLALGGQVGSNLMVNSGTVTLGSAKVAGEITLASASAHTTLVLSGADGVPHKLELGPLAPGIAPFTLDPTALGVPAGTYTMQVQTSSAETPAIEILGRLNSVRLSSSGSMMLNVANVGEVAPGAVTGFNGKSSSLAVAAAN
ncbi:flagellar basal-body rod modification protein FlgD [Oxalobacteraceae bacterium GrIS 1.11]